MSLQQPDFQRISQYYQGLADETTKLPNLAAMREADVLANITNLLTGIRESITGIQTEMASLRTDVRTLHIDITIL